MCLCVISVFAVINVVLVFAVINVVLESTFLWLSKMMS